MMNRRFWNRVKSTNKVILARLASINLKTSQKIAEEKRFTGLLISLISLESAMGGLKFRVISSAPYSHEIEEGLKQPEFRTYAEYPKLREWAKQKLEFIPRYGLTVGSSPGGIPHPSGLHFMSGGLEIAYQMSNNVISQELRKLGC